tara:strand:+ start:5461 stop:5655 length:195 start_codon:yes stop_codon:yes gene_type:complete
VRIQTENAKTVAHQLIDQLPDDADWEKILYTLQIRKDIEAGLADVEVGRVVTTEQLRKDLDFNK